MINWPPSLVKEIVQKRCIFFLGAGVSASAADGEGNRPPSWEEFLVAACKLVSDADKRRRIERLISERKFLVALQAIADNSDRADYHNLLDRTFNNPRFMPSPLHKIIYELDAKVVITTNFDKIYEKFCSSDPGGEFSFKTLDYTSSDLADELRSDARLIVKAHGSIDQISKMIFTRSEYHKAKGDYSRFYEVLRAIFITNTILFIGCSLDDPDILLILEDVKIYGQHRKPHYALMLSGKQDEFAIRDWNETYNIRVLEYAPDHAALISDMEQLLAEVNAERAALLPAMP